MTKRSRRPVFHPGVASWAVAAGFAGLAAFLILATAITGLSGGAAAPFLPPSAGHLLGTDDIGRDLLGQLIAGAMPSLVVGLGAGLLATVIGGLVGSVSGMAGGWLDRLLNSAVQVALTLPFLPLVLVVAACLGAGAGTQVLAVGLVASGHTARLVRSLVLEARSRGHVEAALAMGSPLGGIVRRHLVPIVAPLLIPQFVRAAGLGILVQSSLSFLGFGDPTSASWGATIASGQARGALLTGAWLWWIAPPALVIAGLLGALALAGARVADGAETRLRRTNPLAADDAAPLRRLAASAARPVAGRSTTAGAALVEVRDVTVTYAGASGRTVVLDGVRLSVDPGEIVALVGESGAGKTTLAMTVLGLAPPGARLESGAVSVQGRDIAALDEEEVRALRGDRITLIPQSALHALDPVATAGSQVAEVIRAHRPMSARAARTMAEALLADAGLPPGSGNAYPGELSGGMRQRVVIAMAIANDPVLLIADEPTTGLDVVAQCELLALLRSLRERRGLAILFISHDLGAALAIADRVAVMRAGRIIEAGTPMEIARGAASAYVRGLVAAAEVPAA